MGIVINERKYYTFAHRYCEMKGCGIMSLSPTMLGTVYDVGSDVNRLLRNNPRFAGYTSDLGRSISYLRYLVEGAEGQRIADVDTAIQDAVYGVAYTQLQLYGEDSFIVDAMDDSDLRLAEYESWENFSHYLIAKALTNPPAEHEYPSIADTEVARACVDVARDITEHPDANGNDFADAIMEDVLEGARRTVSRVDTERAGLSSLPFVKQMREFFPDEMEEMAGYEVVESDYEDVPSHENGLRVDVSHARIEEMREHFFEYFNPEKVQDPMLINLHVMLANDILHRNTEGANAIIDAFHYSELRDRAYSQGLEVESYVNSLDDVDIYPFQFDDLTDYTDKTNSQAADYLKHIVQQAMTQAGDHDAYVAYALSEMAGLVEPGVFGRDSLDDAVLDAVVECYKGYGNKDDRAIVADLMVKKHPELTARDETYAHDYGKLGDLLNHNLGNLDDLKECSLSAAQSLNEHASQVEADWTAAVDTSWARPRSFSGYELDTMSMLVGRFMQAVSSENVKQANQLINAMVYQSGIETGLSSVDVASIIEARDWQLTDFDQEDGHLSEHNQTVLTEVLKENIGHTFSKSADDNPSRGMDCYAHAVEAFTCTEASDALNEDIMVALSDVFDHVAWDTQTGNAEVIATRTLRLCPEILERKAHSEETMENVFQNLNQEMLHRNLVSAVVFGDKEMSSDLINRLEIGNAVDFLEERKRLIESVNEPVTITREDIDLYYAAESDMCKGEVCSTEGRILQMAHDKLSHKSWHIDGVTVDGGDCARAMAVQNSRWLRVAYGDTAADTYLDSLDSINMGPENGVRQYVANLVDMAQVFSQCEDVVQMANVHSFNVAIDMAACLNAKEPALIDDIYAREIKKIFDALGSDLTFGARDKDRACATAFAKNPELLFGRSPELVDMLDVMSGGIEYIKEHSDKYSDCVCDCADVARGVLMAERGRVLDVVAPECNEPESDMGFEME